MKNNSKIDKNKLDFMLKKYNYKALEEYKNNRTKFICEDTNTKYRYSIRIDRIDKYKPSLWGLVNEVNFEYNIKLWLKNNTKNILYLDYKKITKNNRKNTLVNLICSCGNNFTLDLTKMVNNGYKVICCNDCKLKKHNIYGIKKGTEKHLAIIENKYTIIDKNVYKNQTINCNTKVDVMDKDGYKGCISSNLCNKAKSFTKFSPNINKKFFKYNINLFYEINGISCECVGNDGNKILLKCKCGNIFSLDNKYIRYSFMCSKCANKESSLERKVSEYLEINNIDFKREYRFSNCKDKVPLPFDFYLPKHNMCIEVDGRQHYISTTYFGGEKEFNNRKYHEKIKNEYCDNHNIKLIRIPYYEFNNDNWKNYLNNII